MENKKLNLINKNGIYFKTANGNIIKYKPWLGDLLSNIYDKIMSIYIFPKKLGSEQKKHLQILKSEINGIENKNILELGTGSGNMSRIISNNNDYEGIDISYKLLKIAYNKFKKANFKKFRLYLASADNLPITNNSIDLCICNLSLNFFPKLEKVIYEVKRVLKSRANFICSVPVPERIKKGSNVRGKLFTEKELKKRFKNADFGFTSLPHKNGVILYFKANIDKD